MSQNKKIDSLLKAYNKVNHDTDKINLLINKIGLEFELINADSAIHYYNKAFNLATDIDNKYLKAKSLQQIGFVNLSKGNFSEALNYFLKSNEEFLSISETTKKSNEMEKAHCSCLSSIGIIYSNLGIYNKAIDFFQQSLIKNEKINDLRGISVVYNNLGLVHFYQKNYDNAIEYFKKSIALKEKLLTENKDDNKLKKGIADTYNNIGMVYENLNDKENALYYYNEALKDYELINYTKGIGLSHNNIGLIYEKLNDMESAELHYKKSLEIKLMIGDKSSISSIYANFSSLYLAKAKSATISSAEKDKCCKESVNYGLKSLELAEQINAIPLISVASDHLKNVYKEMGNYTKAFIYSEKFIETKDSLFNADKTKAITEMETKYQTEKKQQEIELLNKDKALQNEEIKKQAIIKNSFIIGFGLILLIAIIIYRNFRQKRKANIILSQKNTEIEQQKEEILSQSELLSETNSQLLTRNTEIEQQKEEILAQRDELETSNLKLQTLNAELEKLSIVASETDNSVVIANEQGTIEWVNAGFRKLYGYTLEQFIKEKGSNLIKASSNEHFLECMMECICDKKSVNYITETFNSSGKKLVIQTTLTPILDENGNLKKFVAIDADITKLKEAEEQIRKEQEKSEALLLNILPVKTATELKETGKATPHYYKKASVLFTDFKGFTMSCEKLTPVELVEKLHSYFVKFDEITSKYKLEKIKTIGDAYMCAGGIPEEDDSHIEKIVKAALEIQQYMEERKIEDEKYEKDVWQLRLGIHTGEIIAGVVGKKKFAYDVWGDTVNTASRMESSGEPGKVNISESTYEFIKNQFTFTKRGMIEAKNKGKISMYFVDGIV
ncbi:MAG: hypothetical protein A2046_01225 [Bacteroidetes bacterium GWA2_30_7]|nr:MAG: hypothetical protein A2046_01225 [Bacteroidetes bacterium GWA2_30_7]